MVIESSVVSHTGKIRQNNEDNFFLMVYTDRKNWIVLLQKHRK